MTVERKFAIVGIMQVIHKIHRTGLIIVGLSICGCVRTENQKSSYLNVIQEDLRTLAQDIHLSLSARSEVIVARVGPIDITDFDLRALLISKNNRNAFSTLQERKILVDELIRRKLILIAAKNEGVPRELAYMLRARIPHEDLLIRYFIEKRHDRYWPVSDQETQQYYATHKVDFGPSKIIEAHVIRLDSQFNADNARKQLANGAPFDQIAKRVSLDSSTVREGGKMPPFRAGSLGTEMDKVFSGLKVGQVSPVTHTSRGFEIYRKDREYLSPASPKAEIQKNIRLTIERQKYLQWLTNFKKSMNYQTSVDEAKLQSLDLN